MKLSHVLIMAMLALLCTRAFADEVAEVAQQQEKEQAAETVEEEDGWAQEIEQVQDADQESMSAKKQKVYDEVTELLKLCNDLLADKKVCPDMGSTKFRKMLMIVVAWRTLKIPRFRGKARRVLRRLSRCRYHCEDVKVVGQSLSHLPLGDLPVTEVQDEEQDEEQDQGGCGWLCWVNNSC